MPLLPWMPRALVPSSPSRPIHSRYPVRGPRSPVHSRCARTARRESRASCRWTWCAARGRRPPGAAPSRSPCARYWQRGATQFHHRCCPRPAAFERLPVACRCPCSHCKPRQGLGRGGTNNRLGGPQRDDFNLVLQTPGGLSSATRRLMESTLHTHTNTYTHALSLALSFSLSESLSLSVCACVSLSESLSVSLYLCLSLAPARALRLPL